jgi:hypothetical protein
LKSVPSEVGLAQFGEIGRLSVSRPERLQGLEPRMLA